MHEKYMTMRTIKHLLPEACPSGLRRARKFLGQTGRKKVCVSNLEKYFRLSGRAALFEGSPGDLYSLAEELFYRGRWRGLGVHAARGTPPSRKLAGVGNCLSAKASARAIVADAEAIPASEWVE